MVGLPDPRLQERACAVVVLKPTVPGFTMEAMRAFLAEKGVARQYWPERLELMAELPRTANGKVDRVQKNEDSVRDGPLAACAIKSLKQADFPRPKGGPVRMRGSFVFDK